MVDLCSAFGDYTCVNTGEVKLVKNQKLSTSFLNTCCALGFNVDEYKFLAHIDDFTSNMFNKTIDKLNIIKDKFNKINKVEIWIGEACTINTCDSLKIVQKILIFMKIDKDKIKYYEDNNDIIIIG